MAEQRYVTLMASLPYHGRLFGARQTPLSRFQLDKRLAWLEPHDAEMLARIEGILRWSKNLLLDSDPKFLQLASNKDKLRDAIRHVLHVCVRVLVSA